MVDTLRVSNKLDKLDAQFFQALTGFLNKLIIFLTDEGFV